MAYPTGDPLYDKQYGLAGSLLDLYDPAAEEERRKKALGQMEDVIARRYARAGETGSSVEKDALQNAAKDFSLDWSERQPTRYAEAIRGSQLPISNLLAGRTQDINKALSEGAITGYYGGQPTLARQTAGENFNLNQEKLQWLKDQSTQDLWGGLLGSVGQRSGLWDWLFPGQGTGYGGGGTGLGGGAGSIPSLVNWATGAKSLPEILSKGWDWLTGSSAGGLGPLSSAEWTNLVNQLGPISDVSDLMAGGLFPLAGSPGMAGAGAVNWTPELIEALYGGTGAAGAGAGAGAAAGVTPWSAYLGPIGALAGPLTAILTNDPGGAAEDAMAKYQQQRLLADPGAREDLVRMAAAGDPGASDYSIISAIDNWPNDGSGFKERFFRALRHEGEFAGAPSQSWPTQAEINALAQLAPWQLPGAPSYAEMYPSAPPLFEPR